MAAGPRRALTAPDPHAGGQGHTGLRVSASGRSTDGSTVSPRPWLVCATSIVWPRTSATSSPRCIEFQSTMVRYLARTASTEAVRLRCGTTRQRAAIDQLEGRIDTSDALEVWEAAVATPPWTGPDVWVHGDMMAASLIVRDDRLCGVIDFGCAAIGDPACDLTLAWITFEGSSRTRFMQSIPVDRGTWARARGWALWKAVVALPSCPKTTRATTARVSAGAGPPSASSTRSSPISAPKGEARPPRPNLPSWTQVLDRASATRAPNWNR